MRSKKKDMTVINTTNHNKSTFRSFNQKPFCFISSNEMHRKPKFLIAEVIALVFILCSLTGSGQQFTIYNTWDFEDASLGAYTKDSIAADFDATVIQDHGSGNIVMDTINGEPTKVLKVTHEANKTSVGFQMFARIPNSDWNEVYLSYNVKFSEEFSSTKGGKLPGLAALPDYTSGQCPVSGQGFGGILLFKRAGRATTYHYDFTRNSCPWSGDMYNKYITDEIYMANGIWYNITLRYVVNSFTNGSPNRDGIRELWVNGKMAHQMNDLILMADDHYTMKIDEIHISNFYGGSGIESQPANECYTYFDNFKTYIPLNDSVGEYELHPPSAILPTPDEIEDRTLYYDSLRTTEGILNNTQYGQNYSVCRDETFLIDAGEGRKVSLDITAGGLASGDYLFFLDGNTADADEIDMVEGTSSSFSGIRESTGRYMFVRFSTDRQNASTGWTGTISFENTTGIPEKKTGHKTRNDIRIIPNPATNSIIIKGIQNEAELSIFDILGRKLIERKGIANNSKLDISKLKKGVYTIHFNDEYKHAMRFIKN